MDEMNRMLQKYLVQGAKQAKKVNIKPVKIDFPLPTQIEGIEHRLNATNTFQLPPTYANKHKPEHLLGQALRLSHLLANWEGYVGKQITVVGWARKARLAAKDTILFVDLVDGSNTEPLQVVIENKVPNWEEVKRANVSYSFKFRGQLEKSQGKGQNVELKMTGGPTELVQIYGRCDDDKYPLHSKNISLETLRDIAHLRPRTQIMGAMSRIKNNLAYATHQFYQNNGFLYIQ